MASNHNPRSAADELPQPCRAGLDKADAETWLDWLEANGYPECELTYRRGHGFTLWWLAPTLPLTPAK